MTSGNNSTSENSLPQAIKISTESFLGLLMDRVSDQNHKRLLKACRPPDLLKGMEEELSNMIQEICDEA